MKIILSEEFVSNPIVSIVIPSYNRSETIGQTIDSVLNQQCRFEFEIIIGDDCSTDNVREVLLAYQKKYPAKIALLFYEKNIGLGANWATCVQHCKGKYLANCDNDDYWHNPQKLHLQVDYLETHPECGVVHTNYRNHNRITAEINEIDVSNCVYEEPLIKSIFTGKFQFCNATMMYRMELVKSKINLDDYIKFQFSLQDWNTWIILSKYTSFHCLPDSTATFGIETESITRPQSYDKLEKRLVEEKKMYKYLCDLFPEDLPFDENGYDLYVNSILLNLAYKKLDYTKANYNGHEMIKKGSKKFKVYMSQNRLGFYLYYSLVKIRLLFKEK